MKPYSRYKTLRGKSILSLADRRWLTRFLTRRTQQRRFHRIKKQRENREHFLAQTQMPLEIIERVAFLFAGYRKPERHRIAAVLLKKDLVRSFYQLSDADLLWFMRSGYTSEGCLVPEFQTNIENVAKKIGYVRKAQPEALDKVGKS